MEKKNIVRISIGVFIGIIFLSILCYFLLTGQKEAKEKAVIQALRTIKSAEELYKSQYERFGSLQELANAEMITQFEVRRDWSSSKYGYYYILNISESDWSCIALPSEWGSTGTRNFVIRSDGCIIYNRIQGCKDFSNP